MTTNALPTSGPGWLARTVQFVRDVRGEIRKVTWPSWDELKKATGVIIVFVMLLGFAIGLLDVFFQYVFVTTLAKLF